MSDMELQPNRRHRLMGGVRARASETYRYDTAPWLAAVAGMWAVGSAATAVCSLGMPTGWGVMFGVAAAIGLNTIAMALFSTTAALLLALIGLPAPRLAVGGAVYVGVVVYWILYYADADFPASLLLSAAVTVVGAAAGWFVRAIVSRKVGWLAKTGLLAVVAATGLLAAQALPGVPDAVPPGYAGPPPQGQPIDDPSAPGSDAYRFFTYGSGQDLHRPEFGREADLISSPVDASAYISKWPWLRKAFWGFDEKRLPLNGKVWMPEGEGPFPLVLMVHGNHLMEYFSEGGYDYLGELLASRGMIAISVDENFLNYSVWSGIPDQDMKVRAWVLLKHLRQIQSFAETADSPFYRRVDFSRVALVGHSRGGQAAAMAADRDRWFAPDADLPALGSYAIRAVAALAPTDTAVDGQRAELEDVYYLTLQGAHDADVDQFYGARQYVRTSFSENSERFKTSLYIANANHSHFNTAWGGFDLSFPEGLFLNRRDLLSGEDQRQIAKVYVSAFLETVFHGQKQYAGLFRDYRVGSDLLPAARYFSRFETGDYTEIAQFDRDNDAFELSDGVTARSYGITDRQDREQGLALEWERSGTYRLEADDGFVDEEEAVGEIGEASLVFAMAHPTPDPASDPEAEGEASEAPLRLTIELEDDEGVSVRLPLDRFMPVQPPPETQYMWLPWLEENVEDGEYEELTETVFQTYEIPLSAFQKANPRFSFAGWNRLKFRFDGGSGKVILDDIGILG